MHHGEGRRKTGAGGGRKNQLITVPPQGRMSGIKKVLPSGKFWGLATLPGVFFFFCHVTGQWISLLALPFLYVLLISHVAEGWTLDWPSPKASLVCQRILLMADAQLVPSLLEHSEGFAILWEVWPRCCSRTVIVHFSLQVWNPEYGVKENSF